MSNNSLTSCQITTIIKVPNMSAWLSTKDHRRKKDDDDEEKSFFLANSSTSSSVSALDANIANPNDPSAFAGKRSKRGCSPFLKGIFVLLVLAGSLRLGWYLGQKDADAKLSVKPHYISTSQAAQMNVEESYHQRLFQIHSATLSNDTALAEEFNIHGGIPSYEKYRTRLLDTYTRFFSPNPDSSGHAVKDPYNIWKHVEEHLTPFKPHALENKEFPKIISSSAKDKTKVIEAFNSWKEKNDDWRLDLFDDDDAKNFIETVFSNLGRFSPNENGIGQEKSAHKPSSPQRSYMEILASMPKNIMRVDTFRYFKVFFDGGLYVDSDTGCVTPIQDWPGVFSSHRKVVDDNDFILRFLTKVALEQQQQAGQKGISDAALTNLFTPNGRTAHSLQQEEKVQYWSQPAVVMALEEDSWLQREDWIALTFARPLQITQWAFMAQPFHPIFLDALGMIMERTERFIAAQASGKEQTDEGINKVLEWTGPGMLTDAVWRYLGAVYGIHPRQMMYNHKGVRLGDTLMYPNRGFRAQDNPDKPNELLVIDHHHLHEWW